MIPRLIATDLDGTIVRRDGTIAPRTIAAFARAERAGARFVLVTGRPPRTMGQIAAAFGNRGIALCSNGALSYDLATGVVTGERLIPGAVMAEAARLMREAIPGIGIAVERGFVLHADDRYRGDSWDSDATITRLADAELFAMPAPKLLGRHAGFTADDLLALARRAAGDVVDLCHSSGCGLVEAAAPGVSKATAVAGLASALGISPGEVLAFGDMPNDQPLLSWAGLSYAVANAHPDAIAAASHVTASCEEDGVAAVLEELFPAVLPGGAEALGLDRRGVVARV